MRLRVPAMDDEVADVGDPSEEVGENEHRITLVQGVGKHQQRSQEAEPPERRGHNDALELLRSVPLNEEAREEHGIAQPAHRLPHAPFDAKKLTLVPDQIRQPIHAQSLGGLQIVGSRFLPVRLP